MNDSNVHIYVKELTNQQKIMHGDLFGRMFTTNAKLAISIGWDGKWGFLHSSSDFLVPSAFKKKSTKHFYN